MKLFNAVLCVFGAAAAVVDVAHRRLVCVRRGYHTVLDPDGKDCLDCWRYIDQRDRKYKPLARRTNTRPREFTVTLPMRLLADIPDVDRFNHSESLWIGTRFRRYKPIPVSVR